MIEIYQPIFFSMDLIETEDNLPSMLFQVKASAETLTRRISFEDRVWFTCESFDQFISSINGSSEAELVSMDECVKLQILRGDRPRFKVSCESKQIPGSIDLVTLCRENDEDEFAKLSESFKNFPRWW